MIIFNTNSWHYNLVLYVFGKSFFFKSSIDDKKLRTVLTRLEDKSRKDNPNDDDAIEKAIKGFKFFDNPEILRYTPKRINFCPYCRAVVFSVILFPFAILSKQIPKRKHKPFDIEKSRRNTKIIKIAVMVTISIFGVRSLIDGNYGLAIFHFTVASFQIWGKYVFEWYSKVYVKRSMKKNKSKKTEPKEKSPGLISAYFTSKHDSFCPSVTFVDENDTEIRR